MDFYSEHLFFAWWISMVPMLIVAFYGLIRCGIHIVDFAIMLIVAFLPVINTLVVLMFALFSFSDWFKKNHSNQY